LLKDPVPEVRAATVYALGTFISSTLERTTQANDLDRQIAMHMLECVSSDMSPLVRMELVAALQWIVKLFDNYFVEVCIREDSQFNGNVSHEHHTRDGSWKRSGSKLKAVSSEKNLQLMDRMAIHCSSNMQTSSYSSIYSKLWHGIVNLSRDPCPDVALMGAKVTEHIRQMAVDLAPTIAMIPLGKEVICDKISTSGGSNSFSLPPSPNTRSFSHLMTNSHSGSSARLNSESSGSATHTREKPHKLRVPIVKTNFVEWEITSMARPLKQLANSKGRKNDQFALETMERKKRFTRNARIRKEALDQQRLAVFHNLKTQSFIGKTSMTPSIVKLHPYEQQIVVAYLDRIMLNDWALNITTSLSPLQLNSSTVSHHSATIQTTTNSGKKMSVTSASPTSLRVSSIQFVNAHDRGLILAGYDDGSVRIWKNNNSNQSNSSSSGNSNLVTAFQALEDQPTRSSRIFGLQTAWHQSTQTIFVGGESKLIRLWDAERELKVQDIPTSSDFPVSHISCAPNALFAVGFGDGSIQIFDRRSHPNDSRIMTYREHSQPLLTICLRNDCESLVSAG
jgi:regulator-associated protein of mTOR